MTHLFIAKLLVPQRPAVAIKRASLLSRLELAASGSVALLRAPAGYGKTSLLIDLANESASAVCWVSLDAWDCDPAVFLAYLNEAIRRALSLECVNEEGSFDDARQMLAAIVDLIATCGRDLDLILDDVHELDGAPATLELVDYLLLRLPSNCRAFLATRTQLPCDSWPRLAAGGRTVQLGADDLLMTDHEIREVWAAGGNDPVDASVLAKLREASRGWPVAVAVAARGGEIDATDVRLQLSEFLVSEVLSKLPDEMLRFIEQTSAFDLLTGARCSALISYTLTQAEAMIRRIGATNVPATVISAQPVEMRLHPLVRELVQARLRTTDEEAFKSQHRIAAELDLKESKVGEALSHYATAEEWDQLASVIARESPRAYREGRWHSVAAWLRLLPTEHLAAKPELAVWQAKILARLGQCDQALALLTDCQALNALIPNGLRCSVETVRSGALRTKGEIGAAVRAGEEAKRLAFSANAAIEIVAEARKELGLSLISQGSFDDGIEELKAALEIHQLRGDASDIAFVNGCLGSAYGSIGRLGESVASLEQARQKFVGLQNSKELSWVLNNLGVAYWFMGNVDKARDVLAECLVAARSGAHRRAEGFALTSLADIDRLLGDLGVGRERYESVLTIAEEVGDVTLGTLALIGLADLERRDGRPQIAEGLAKRSIASAEARLARSEEALARVVLARLARQSVNVDCALEESAAALAELGSEGVARDLCEALVCRAEVLVDLRSHRAELTSTLRRLDDVISQLGHGLFLLYSDRAQEILRYAVARRISDSYRTLLQKFERISAEPDDAWAAYPPITVKALGGFEVTVGGRELATIEWESEKSRELFLLLLVTGRPMTRDEMVANLWPDGDRRKATSAFHSTLYRTRRALYSKVIVETGGWYNLQSEASFSSDVQHFLQLTQASHSEESGDEIHRLNEALKTHGGLFAPNLFSEWAEEVRKQLHERFLGAALRLGNTLQANREYERAIDAFKRVLDSDSFNEDAWYGLLLAEAAVGGRSRAARAFGRYEQLLRSELEEAPSMRIALLYQQLREQRSVAS